MVASGLHIFGQVVAYGYTHLSNSGGKESMEDDPVVQEGVLRREYSRVDSYVPFDYRIIGQEEKDHIQARIAGSNSNNEWRPQVDLSEHDQVLGEWLKMLSAKLDTIIRLITLQREGYFGLPSKAINISGGGLSFSAAEGIVLGQVLEMKMMLTLQQPIALSIYGEVVKSEKQEQAYFIAVQYVHMDESVRDEIIRYVFERERELIREKLR